MPALAPGFLGMLGLVVAIESTLAGHDLDFTAPWHWDWRVVGKAATRPDRVRDREVLIFGDSLAKFGLMPRVIRRGSGKATYNFALHTGQASSSYFMLRRTLRAGASPSSIVLDLTPHMLMHFPEVNNNLWPELLTVEEAFELARSMRNPGFFGSVVLASVLPSYKERHDIRAGLMAAIGGKSVSRRDQIPMYRGTGRSTTAPSSCPTARRCRSTPTSGSATCIRVGPQPDQRRIPRPLPRPGRLEGDPGLLAPPAAPPGRAGEDRRQRLRRRLHRVRPRRPGPVPSTIVVDARDSGFAADHFFDGAHVNRRGALALSGSMAEVLRAPPEAGRWVALDRGRARGADLPMEDVFQSAEALKAEAATRRR